MFKFLTVLMVLSNGSILQNYDALSDDIKSILVQTVIEDDLTAFTGLINDLGFDITVSSLLFDAIGRVASPQLGPGLAFGQFERKTAFTQNDVIENVPFEYLSYARNIELSATNGIKFKYPGIYRMTVQFRGGSTTSSTHTLHAARIIGWTSNYVVGRSVLSTSGSHATFSTRSLSFLIEINDVSDVYMLQFLKHSSSFTIPTTVDSTFTPYPNIMLLVENVGHL